MNRALINSYEQYRKAFYEDLNHFYSGVAALQMGTVLLDFSRENAWYDAFDSDSEAEDYKRRVEEEVNTLRCLVPASVSAGLQRMSSEDSDRCWAKISNADVLFLTLEGREQRVVTAYSDAVPPDKVPFAWDAAKGQLNLFACLGIKTDLAEKVIRAIAPRFEDQAMKRERPRRETETPSSHRLCRPSRRFAGQDRAPIPSGAGSTGRVTHS
ncbi:MAG: hypothetical protein MZV70_34890 [Desulfobacterales bacterium]|nr:hypothetical protein [Desulfobacterales bacterium]